MDFAARVTALDLDRRVPDGEAVAKASLETTNDMLGVTQGAFTDDDVAAERHLV
jgi:hypothetical protein